jgi:hypothetical protein
VAGEGMGAEHEDFVIKPKEGMLCHQQQQWLGWMATNRNGGGNLRAISVSAKKLSS